MLLLEHGSMGTQDSNCLTKRHRINSESKEDSEPWRHGEAQRHKDTKTKSHGDMETQRHGDTETQD